MTDPKTILMYVNADKTIVAVFYKFSVEYWKGRNEEIDIMVRDLEIKESEQLKMKAKDFFRDAILILEYKENDISLCIECPDIRGSAIFAKFWHNRNKMIFSLLDKIDPIKDKFKFRMNFMSENLRLRKIYENENLIQVQVG